MRGEKKGAASKADFGEVLGYPAAARTVLTKAPFSLGT